MAAPLPDPSPEPLLREGFARQQGGDPAGAEALYRKALACAPGDHRALTLLASLKEAAGDMAAAIDGYRAVVVASPAAPAPRMQLAKLVLKADPAEALELLRPVTEALPGQAQPWRLRGTAAEAVGALEEAAESYRRAIQAGDTGAWPYLGRTLQALAAYEDAQAAYEQALQHSPDNALIHGALGNVLSALGRRADAIARYKRAVALKPDLYEAHGSLGVELQGLGRYEDAAAAYNAAIAGAPDRWEVLNNLGGCRLDQGRPRQAQAVFRDLIRRNQDFMPAKSNLCMAIAYDADRSPADLAAACGDAVAHMTVAERPPLRPWRDRPLKIGLVSADLRAHSVGAFVGPLFDHFDPGQMSLIAYANVRKPDAVTERLRARATLWRDTMGLSTSAVADQVRADRVDILIDLAGHTGDTRLDLFAHRPAPVQASWLGWPATTGLSAIDFKLSDRLLTPEGATDEPFVERPLNLDGPALCFRPADDAPAVALPPFQRNGAVTFGSFNRIAKTSPGTLELWSSILAALPTARLFLKDNAFRCPAARDHFQARLAAAGVDGSRVTLAGSTATKQEHLALYGEIDIALDSMPYNGVTTTAEALWMGVPTVTLAGESSLARYGLTVMTHAGLPDWVAETPEAYVVRAIAAAEDQASLAAFRAEARDRLPQTPLFNAPAFAQSFANACRRMMEGVEAQI